MTPLEHYREAERLRARAQSFNTETERESLTQARSTYFNNAALVHATLAAAGLGLLGQADRYVAVNSVITELFGEGW